MARDLEEQLLTAFRKLSPADQAAVTHFAEFIQHRSCSAGDVSESIVPVAKPVPEPVAIPRPEQERVVAAVKRLSSTYFMLDKTKMLGITSDLLTQHVLQGRDAAEVIDELEQIFSDHYQLHKGKGGS